MELKMLRMSLVAVFVLAFASSAAHSLPLSGPRELYTTAVGSAPAAVAWSPAAAEVFVANSGSGTVSVVDELEGQTVAEIPVGAAPQGLVIDPIQQRVYVALGQSGQVAVLDAITGAFLRHISIPQCTGVTGPWGLTVNPVTSVLYVACYSANTVVAVQDTTGTILKSVTTGSGPLGIVVDPVTNWVYVGQYGESEIRVLDGATLATFGRVRTGVVGGIWGLALDPVTHRVFAANYKQGTIQVILGVRVIATYGGFSGPEWISFDAVRGQVWIPENTSSRVTGLDPLNGTVNPVAISGTKPTAVAVNPALGIVYSANFGSASVSAIQQ